jgi:hypothetical protein
MIAMTASFQPYGKEQMDTVVNGEASGDPSGTSQDQHEGL